LESRCICFTALPNGSALFLNEGFQAIASGVLQAIVGTRFVVENSFLIVEWGKFM
jgi:hypothetical protein